MRRVVFILLLLTTLRICAQIEVKGTQFYKNGEPWRIMGVNLTDSQCTKAGFNELSTFGWNSVRVVPTSIKQLKHYVRLAKREQLKLCVVCSSAFPFESVQAFKHDENIWAWEVESVSDATIISEKCPNHLITISITPKLESLDNALMTPQIDFISLPLTPLDFQWVSPTSLFHGLRNCYLKSTELLETIERRMALTPKPLVISSCAYPRDKMFRLPESYTSLRDSYFSFVINYKSTHSQFQLSGIYFDKWESVVNDNTSSQPTPLSIYATDTLTKKILF